MTLEERANKIAELANTCCGRSDGYQEDVYSLALEMLMAADEEAHKRGWELRREGESRE